MTFYQEKQFTRAFSDKIIIDIIDAKTKEKDVLFLIGFVELDKVMKRRDRPVQAIVKILSFKRNTYTFTKLLAIRVNEGKEMETSLSS